MLTHTSGIHSYTSKPDFLANATVGVKPEDHIKSFKNDPFDFNPGEKWLYNNSGYFLLGYIIEKVSGKSYADYPLLLLLLLPCRLRFYRAASAARAVSGAPQPSSNSVAMIL